MPCEKDVLKYNKNKVNQYNYKLLSGFESKTLHEINFFQSMIIGNYHPLGDAIKTS